MQSREASLCRSGLTALGERRLRFGATRLLQRATPRTLDRNGCMSDIVPSDENALVERLRTELAKSEPSRRRRIIEKFIMAVLGSIPWVGGFLSAAADYKAEEGALRQDSLQTQWLEEHHAKLVALKETLVEIQRRFEALGSVIDERIQ